MWIDQGALKYGMKAKFLFKKRFLSNFQVAHVYTASTWKLEFFAALKPRSLSHQKASNSTLWGVSWWSNLEPFPRQKISTFNCHWYIRVFSPYDLRASIGEYRSYAYHTPLACRARHPTWRADFFSVCFRLFGTLQYWNPVATYSLGSTSLDGHLERFVSSQGLTTLDVVANRSIWLVHHRCP